MLTLYGALGSGSAGIEAALGLAGVAWRQVEAAPWDAATPGLEELRAINPLTQIPTLRLADGSVLTESAAILIHLGLEHPASGLLPADASARAQVLRGLGYIAANCYAAIGVIDYPERWTTDTGEPAREAVRAGARLRLHGLWTTFADGFAPAADVGVDELNALDIFAATVSRWSGARAHLQSARPVFFERLRAIDTHPAVAPVWARHWPALNPSEAA